MDKSYYQFMMQFRWLLEDNNIRRFSIMMYEDTGFPKFEKDFHILSNYLEQYGYPMATFDQTWKLYRESSQFDKE